MTLYRQHAIHAANLRREHLDWYVVHEHQLHYLERITIERDMVSVLAWPLDDTDQTDTFAVIRFDTDDTVLLWEPVSDPSEGGDHASA